jgi:hypothetical protein
MSLPNTGLRTMFRNRIQHFRSMRIRRRMRIQPTKTNADPCRSRSGTLVADPEPGSGVFLALGSGIQNGFFRIPDSRSRILNPYIFESLVTILWVKSTRILCKLAQIFYFFTCPIPNVRYPVQKFLNLEGLRKHSPAYDVIIADIFEWKDCGSTALPMTS